MLRFLVKFLLLAIILVAATILFAQWKLEKDIDSFARVVSPVADFDYDSAKISITGEVRINSIRIYFDRIKATMEVGELRFFAGNLFQLALFESHLRQHQLPENAHLILTDVLLPFSQDMLKSLKPDSPPDSLDLIAAAYCGDNDRMGIKQIEAMGFNYLSFSSKSFYLLDKYSGSVVINGDASVEEMFDLEYQINISGVLAWLESLEEKGVGQYQPPVDIPELALFELRHKDNGFNRKKAEYCAIKQGIETEQYVEEYIAGHVKGVESFLSKAEIRLTDQAREAYINMLKPQSSLTWFLQPKANFDFDGISYYNEAEFLDLSGLRVSVNNQRVEHFFDNWRYKAFVQIAPNLLNERALQQAEQENYLPEVVNFAFEEVHPGTAQEYLEKTVRITRDDGRSFEGILSRSSDKSLWLLQRSPNGDVTIPFERVRVVKFEVYR